LAGFIVRANSFDNVAGDFPIGFTIWNLAEKEKISEISCDIIENNGDKAGVKKFCGELPPSINKWIKLFDNGSKPHIAYMGNPAPDFQNNKFLNIEREAGTRHVSYFAFTQNNIIHGSIYFAVRQVISANWLNDRDQFLYPNELWQEDTAFHTDCLVYTIFHGQNRISCRHGINHWIPFTEKEVNASEKFDSDFMSKFIKGKLKPDTGNALFGEKPYGITPLVFSPEAQIVFDAGRELWKYFHAQKGINVNASLYDIREFFQGRNENGKMKNRAADTQYGTFIGNLRDALKDLALKIEPKVYEYGFLRR
jgi:hypothetical protein